MTDNSTEKKYVVIDFRKDPSISETDKKRIEESIRLGTIISVSSVKENKALKSKKMSNESPFSKITHRKKHRFVLVGATSSIPSKNDKALRSRFEYHKFLAANRICPDDEQYEDMWNEFNTPVNPMIKSRFSHDSEEPEEKEEELTMEEVD